MPNVLLNLLTALLIVSGPPAAMPEPNIDSDGEILRGTAEEKLEYMYNHCKTLDDVRRLARGFEQLANSYDAAGRSLNAELSFLLAVRFLESAFPNTDPDIGLAYEGLAGHYASLGEHALARKANARALTILRHNRANYPVELAVALHNEAWLDMQEHRFSRAETCLRESMAIAREKLGNSHLLVGMLANSLGDLYIERNDYLRAEPFLQEALEIVRKNPGNEKLQHVIKENYISVLKINHKFSAIRKLQETLH